MSQTRTWLRRVARTLSKLTDRIVKDAEASPERAGLGGGPKSFTAD